MSRLLEEAIIDAEALKKAAAENAKNLIVEKYADEIKKTINTVLEGYNPMTREDEETKPMPDMQPIEQNDDIGRPNGLNEPCPGCPPADGGTNLQTPSPDDEVILDFDALRAAVEAEMNVGEDLGMDPNKVEPPLPHEDLVMEEKGAWQATVHDEEQYSYEVYYDNPQTKQHIEMSNEKRFHDNPSAKTWRILALDEKTNEMVYRKDGLTKKEAMQELSFLKTTDWSQLTPVVTEEGNAMSTGAVEGTAIAGVKRDPEVEINEKNIMKLVREALEEGFDPYSTIRKHIDAQSREDYIRQRRAENKYVKDSGTSSPIEKSGMRRANLDPDSLSDEDVRGDFSADFGNFDRPHDLDEQLEPKQKKHIPGQPWHLSDVKSDGVGPDREAIDEAVKVDHQIVPSGNVVGANVTDYSLAVEAMKEIVAKRDTKWQEENKELKKQLKNLQENYNKLVVEKNDLLINVKDVVNKLNESNLRSGKLLYMNKVLRNLSLNERQKKILTEAIEKTNTLEQAKAIFETNQVVSSGEREKEKDTTLLETVGRSNRTFVVNSGEEKEEENPVYARMRHLAGIKDKK